MLAKWYSKRFVLCALSLVLCIALCSCGRNTKKGTEGVEYDAVDGSYIVTGYHGTDVNVIIPDKYNEIPVTGIAEYAFEESEIQSVIIGKNVTYIGYGAFAYSTLLKEVSIPAAVEVIDGTDRTNHYGVFEYCISLEKVTIEKGSALTRIGSNAFKYCESLKEILLPEGLQRIEDRAFAECISVDQLTIPETVEFVGQAAFLDFTEDQEIVINGNTENWQQEVEQLYNIDGQIVSAYPYRGWDYECNAKIVEDNKHLSPDDNEEKKAEDEKTSLFGEKGVYLISKKTIESENLHKVEEYSYSKRGEWEATDCNLEDAIFEYNNDGYVIKETYYTDESKETVASYVEISRDNDNNIVKLDINYCYNENEYGIFRMVQNYSFFENGTMEKCTVEGGYCKKGEWAQETYWVNETHFEYEYKDDKLVTVHEIPTDSNQTQYRYEYEYDDVTGLLKCRTRYAIVDGVESVSNIHSLYYDANGNVSTLMSSGFEFTSNDSVLEYEYKYFDVKQAQGMFGTSETIINELMFIGMKN